MKNIKACLKEDTNYCIDCAHNHILTVATHKIVWDLGSKWVCEECYQEYHKGGFA